MQYSRHVLTTLLLGAFLLPLAVAAQSVTYPESTSEAAISTDSLIGQWQRDDADGQPPVIINLLPGGYLQLHNLPGRRGLSWWAEGDTLYLTLLRQGYEQPSVSALSMTPGVEASISLLGDDPALNGQYQRSGIRALNGSLSWPSLPPGSSGGYILVTLERLYNGRVIWIGEQIVPLDPAGNAPFSLHYPPPPLYPGSSYRVRAQLFNGRSPYAFAEKQFNLHQYGNNSEMHLRLRMRSH